MTTQTDARAPYLSISVQIDTPNAPRIDGRPVRLVSWIATRYDGAPAPTFRVYAHFVGTDEPHLTLLLETTSLASPDLPTWVPRPPAGWLASLKMTEPDNDLVGRMSAAIDRATFAGGF